MSKARDTSFDHLIPELPRWNGGEGVSVDDWIGCLGRHDHAIGYSRLFWPDFVLHDGCLLHAGFSEEVFAGFMQQTGGDRRSVEATMNHQHLADMLMGTFNAGERPTRDQLVYLGRTMQQMWTARLKRDFPALDVVVSWCEQSADDLDGYQITVFQAR